MTPRYATVADSVSYARFTLQTMSTATYLRVSTGHQTVEQQRDTLAAANIAADREFVDIASGRAGADRPGWRDCLDWLREGDTLVVAAVDRIGRSVREVAEALHTLTERGIALRSLREGVDTGTPTGRAVVQIMSSIAELELELGKERRAASRETRLARGLPATRPPKLAGDQRERLVRLYRNGEPVEELAAMFGVSRATVFRYVRVAG
ncbi:resolvase domain-containing protein [Mycobacteroides abscessus]|nr:resolvase domain-containing protein [Mycobacteroides abscessus]CRG61196.1 resolvase domain-containing protein [Mycobacteroides abscessus]